MVLPPCGQTDIYENIIFPKLAGGKYMVKISHEIFHMVRVPHVLHVLINATSLPYEIFPAVPMVYQIWQWSKLSCSVKMALNISKQIVSTVLWRILGYKLKVLTL